VSSPKGQKAQEAQRGGAANKEYYHHRDSENTEKNERKQPGGRSGWIDRTRGSWEFPTMHTLIVDSKKRIRLPDAEANQVFAYERLDDGRLVLTRVVKEDPAEAFPRGSLGKYLTRAKAKEEMVLLKGCSLEVPE
jgi:hypothetical protein